MFALSLFVALVTSATPSAAPPAAPSPSASPLATAPPNLIAEPKSTAGLHLPPVPDVAPTFGAPDRQLPSAKIAGDVEPFVGLSVDDAVGMALARNTDLAVSQSNRRIAGYRIVAAKGVYDVNFQVQPTYSFSRQASVSSFEAGPGGDPIQQIEEGATGGFSGDTILGGHYSLTTTADRIDNNVTVDSYEPYYQTAIALAITQPLARGLRIDENRRQLALAVINGDLTTQQALAQASTSIDNVLIAYYNLIAAWKNVGIQEDALRQAKAQSESNARLVRAGQTAPIDVVESDTQVQEFQNDVYSAIANVATLQNTLKTLILNDPTDPLWTANVVPTSPISNFIEEPDVKSVVLSALAQRPEVGELRDSFRQAGVNLAYAKDQKLPQVDLRLGITENGFAGAPTNPNANPFAAVIGSQVSAINALIVRSNLDNPGLTPLDPISGSALDIPLYPGTVGKFGASYHTALAGDFPEYSVTATIGFPLQNRTAEGNYRAALEQRNQVQTQEVALIQRVEYEARNAVEGYRSARSRLVAATAARVAAEKVAASEIRKFKAGASTTFLVLQRQVTLANERGQELQAQSDVQKALVELDRVTGAILAKNGVTVSKLGTAPVPKFPLPAPGASPAAAAGTPGPASR